MTEQPLVLISGYAASDAPGVYTFTFDEATGSLDPFTSFSGITNPSYVVGHPNGKWLYAVSETAGGEGGGVWSLEFDRAARTMQPINQQLSGGDFPCHLSLDATAKWLFVSNYGTGSASVFPIRADGSLGEATERVQHHGKGPNAQRQEGPHAHSTTLTPDNRFAIVADLGIDQLVVYALDSLTGKLRLHAQVPARAGAGPRHLTFHPTGRILYVANELANTVAVYEYDAANGALVAIQMLDTLPPGAPENTAADIHISSAGDRVYVSNRGHNSIAVFAARGDGKLERVGIVSCGGDFPRNFALAPGGQYILVANQNSGDVTVLPLRNGMQEIGASITQVSVPGASCIQAAFYKA